MVQKEAEKNVFHSENLLEISSPVSCLWLRSCRSLHVCYFDDKLTQIILPHLNLAKIILPLTATAATSVDKTMQFAQFSPDANTLSHIWPFLLRPSACFCTLGVNRGQQRRRSFGWQDCNRVRPAEAEPPSHNSCSVIVASKGHRWFLGRNCRKVHILLQTARPGHQRT